MVYLLDTCTVSDFAKGEPNTLSRLKSVSPSLVSISVLTLMEIRYGMAINPQCVAKIRQVIEDFLISVTIIPFAEKEAEEAALIRSILKVQRTPIDSYDLLIAATAKTHHLKLVTSNINEFSLISGLELENWRQN
jgi:tRNA(fMet)-specific endonuclease VapC